MTAATDIVATQASRPRIGLLHGLRVSIDGKSVEITKQKSLALLALLTIAAPRRVTRERLRGLLWADSSETDAQNSLRNTLSLLRAQLVGAGYDGLRASRQEVWLEPGSFTTDLQVLRAKIADGHVDRALFADQTFPDSILAGLSPNDLFEEHIATYRKEIAGELAAAAAIALSGQTSEGQIELLSLLVDLEPQNEAHHRALIERLVQNGRKADALAVYQRLWSHLDAEFGEEPSAKTQALIVALKQSSDGLQTQEDDRPVLVVRLEPGAGSGDWSRRQDVLNLVLSSLGRFREWRVFDDRLVADQDALRTQSTGPLCALTLATSPKEVSDAGLTAERVTAILSDLRTGQVIWSDQMGRDHDIAPNTLDGITRRFATAINLHLSGPGRPALVVQTDAAASHYELWIEAQQKLRAFTVSGWRDAEVALNRILTEDPHHVRALSARASIETMRQIAFPGVFPTPESHRLALAWASKAVLVDPMDSRAQLSLAWACTMSRQFDRAAIAYELAYQHNENDPWTIASTMVGFAFCDDTARAESLGHYLNQLGLALEPFHWSYMAAASFLLGDDNTCVQYSERAQEISCDVPAWHAAALAHSGRIDEARHVAGRFLLLSRAQWVSLHPPADADITAWVLACFPIRSRQRWDRLRLGLEMAGLRLSSQ